MKNILTLFFVLLMSASVAMAQSTSTNNDSKSNMEQVAPTPVATPAAGNCMGKAAKSGKSCCQKKSNAQSCEGKAAKEACCSKHGSKAKEEEEN